MLLTGNPEICQDPPKIRQKIAKKIVKKFVKKFVKKIRRKICKKNGQKIRHKNSSKKFFKKFAKPKKPQGTNPNNAKVAEENGPIFMSQFLEALLIRQADDEFKKKKSNFYLIT